MANKYLFLETDQYKKEAPKWLEALKRQENATVIFFPKNDRLIRLTHFIEDKKMISSVLGDPEKYIFLKLTLIPDDLESTTDFENQLTNQLNGEKLGKQFQLLSDWIDYLVKSDLHLILIISEAELYLNQELKHVLSFISQISESYAPIVQILTLFESNFTHSTHSIYMPPSTRLYENIFSYPLYGYEDTQKFLMMLESLWDLKLSSHAKDSIITSTGGHFWLVKQAVREVTSFGDWKIESEGMMFRLRTIFNFMLPSEQEVIKKIITNKNNFDADESNSLKHLTKMRVLDDKKQCLIGAFEELIMHPLSHVEEIILKNNHVYVNEVPVDKLFTKKELRVLKLLLEYSGKIVTRDDIALRMWPIHTQEEYSDWAIDQLMTRLRKSLLELSISPKIIQVIRGQGYRLNLPQSRYESD